MKEKELVIKISEEKYNYIKKQVADGIDNPLKVIIANGTPLPKGHGNLIDVKDTFCLIAEGKNGNAYFGTVNKDWEVIDFLKLIQPIIEADKEEAE